MGLRDIFSSYVYRQMEKRGLYEDIHSHSIRFGGSYADDGNILESSDVYELLQDISNQMMLAEVVVENRDGKELSLIHI